jgi:hypothetical protein
LGELQSDDDRPELLLAQDGEWQEDFQKAINDAVAHGWDNEFAADDILLSARRMVIDFGVSAIRCRFDPTKGAVKQEAVPHYQGKPVLDIAKANELLQNGPRGDVQMKTIREGKIVWEPLTPFNLLVPPGIVHERDMPWIVVVRPQPLDQVQDEFGDAAKDLVEDGDIGSVLGIGANEMRSAAGNETSGGTSSRLRGHVWVFTCYEMPCGKYPKGRRIVLGSNQMELLAADEQLPYMAPDGSYRPGIAFFHWWRLNDRFWSRAFVEGLKDPQRAINRRETQKNEIIDRGMPFVLVPNGSEVAERRGVPVEVIAVDMSGANGGQPIVNGGIPPGEWFFRDIELQREHASHASTLSPLRLGENPQNVDTYSQLALLNENEQVKRQPIVKEHKQAIEQLVEDSVYDIRTYWGPDKKVLVEGEEGQVAAHVFDATKVPAFYIVRFGKGSAKPRSQAAELKKVDDIAKYSIEAGTPLPVDWYKQSLDAGQPQELPEQPTNDQADAAQLENELMFHGNQVEPRYYDNDELHVQIHRSAQIRADMADNVDVSQLVEQHIQAHMAQAQAQAAQAPPSRRRWHRRPDPAAQQEQQPAQASTQPQLAQNLHINLPKQ